ncbi:MAG: hypothetical protein AAFQ81_02075, partial [Pseudomonadota bacterium]
GAVAPKTEERIVSGAVARHALPLSPRSDPDASLVRRCTGSARHAVGIHPAARRRQPRRL